MKRFLIVTATIVVLWSCEKERGGDEPSGMQDVIITCGQEETKVSGTDDASTGVITFKWQNGDYIYVQEGIGAYQYFPIEGGAGTVTGKFRGEVTASAGSATVFNVQWPDTTPDLSSQTYVANGIDGAKMLATKTITGLSNLKKSFTLVPQYAVVRLELKGSLKVKTLAVTAGSSTYVLNCTSVQLNDATAVPFHVVVEPASDQKLSVKASYTDGTTSESFSNTASMTFAAGKTYKLNELYLDRPGEAVANEINGWTTSSGDAALSNVTTLSTNGTANCYIIEPKAGFYRFPLYQGNSTTKIDAKSAKVVWETVNTDTAPASGTIVSETYILNGWCYFKTTGTKEGNALIAVCSGEDVYGDKNGAILWSWHIWKTDTPADITFKNSAGKLMDRNLGALSTSGNTCAGLFYQWGRKDPLPGPTGIKTTTTSRIAQNGTQYSKKSRTKAIDYYSDQTTALLFTIRNPTVYVCGVDSGTDNSQDWYSDEVHTKNLWGLKSGSKTIYDPCPPGYMVPYGGKKYDSSDNVKSFFGNATGYTYGYRLNPYETYSNVTYTANSGATIKLSSGTAFFPLTGYNIDGNMREQGEAGQYWTTYRGGYDTSRNWVTSRATCFNVNKDSFATLWGSNRADACSVRCMKL